MTFYRALCLLTVARIHLELGDRRGLGELREAEMTLESENLAWPPAEQADYKRTRDLARDLERS